MNDTIIMEVFDARENGVNDSSGVPFCEFSFLHNSFKQLSANSQLERQVVFGSRLKPLVELDLSKSRSMRGRNEVVNNLHTMFG